MRLTPEQRQALQAQAVRLRTGLSVDAVVDLPDLFQNLATHLEREQPSALPRFSALMAQCLAQWQRQDWIGLADSLAHEFD